MPAPVFTFNVHECWHGAAVNGDRAAPVVVVPPLPPMEQPATSEASARFGDVLTVPLPLLPTAIESGVPCARGGGGTVCCALPSIVTVPTELAFTPNVVAVGANVPPE